MALRGGDDGVDDRPLRVVGLLRRRRDLGALRCVPDAVGLRMAEPDN